MSPPPTWKMALAKTILPLLTKPRMTVQWSIARRSRWCWLTWGKAMEQHFWRRLELWDCDDDSLVAESTAEQITEDRHDLVLILAG